MGIKGIVRANKLLLPTPPMMPELNKNGETSGATRLAGGVLIFRLVVFINKQKDLLLPIASATSLQGVTVVGSASRGLFC